MLFYELQCSLYCIFTKYTYVIIQPPSGRGFGRIDIIKDKNNCIYITGSAKKLYFYVASMYMWNILLLVCYTIFILFLYHSFFIKINPLWVLFDNLFDLHKREHNDCDTNSVEFHNTKYKEILNQITNIIENNSKNKNVEYTQETEYLSVHEKEQMKTEMRETISSIISTK